MLPSQFKRLIASLAAIREALENEKLARRDAQESIDQKWSDVPGIIASNILGTADDRKAAESQQERENSQQEDLVTSQKDLVKWTQRAFIAAAIYAGVAVWQGCLMNRTYEQMQKATEASTRSVDLAADSLETTQSQFDRAMALTIDQTTAQVKSADAAQKAVGASGEQMRLDQRAWVGMTAMQVITRKVPPMTEQTVTDLGAYVINFGRSPALRVEAFIGSYAHPGDYVPGPEDERWMRKIIEMTTSHAFDGKTNISGANFNFSQSWIDDNKDTIFDKSLKPPGTEKLIFDIPIPVLHRFGSLPAGVPFPVPLPGGFDIDGASVIVYAKIKYTDIFNRERVTIVCQYRLKAHDGPYQACPVFNEMK